MPSVDMPISGHDTSKRRDCCETVGMISMFRNKNNWNKVRVTMEYVQN